MLNSSGSGLAAAVSLVAQAGAALCNMTLQLLPEGGALLACTVEGGLPLTAGGELAVASVSHSLPVHLVVVDRSPPTAVAFTRVPAKFSGKQQENATFAVSAMDKSTVAFLYALCLTDPATSQCVDVLGGEWAQHCGNAPSNPGAPCVCSTEPASGNVTCAWSFVVGPLPDGAYTLTLLAKDTAGNTATVSYSWRVDTVPPQSKLLAGPPAVVASSSAAFRLGCSDPGQCSYMYIVDPGGGVPPPLGAAWTSLSIPTVAEGLAHTATAITMVTQRHSDGKGAFVSTGRVSFDLATAPPSSLLVQFEYIRCAGVCTPSQMTAWTKLAVGQSAFSVEQGDGLFQLLARVAGTSVLGKEHPTSNATFVVRTAKPVTLVQRFLQNSFFSSVDASFGTQTGASAAAVNASAVLYSLDDGPWLRVAGHELQLRVRSAFFMPGLSTSLVLNVLIPLPPFVKTCMAGPGCRAPHTGGAGRECLGQAG